MADERYHQGKGEVLRESHSCLEFKVSLKNGKEEREVGRNAEGGREEVERALLKGRADPARPCRDWCALAHTRLRRFLLASDEEQERDAPATGEEGFWILDFGF